MSDPSIDPSAVLLGGALSLAVYVWVGLALSRVFRKSGVEGWKAWVPVLNTVVLLQLGGFSGWLVLLGFVPGINIALFAVLIIAFHRINLSFGHGAGMTVLAALFFPVWATILGFGSSRWVGRETVPPAGPVRTGVPQNGGPTRPPAAPTRPAAPSIPATSPPRPPVTRAPAPAPAPAPSVQTGWMPQPPPPPAPPMTFPPAATPPQRDGATPGPVRTRTSQPDPADDDDLEPRAAPEPPREDPSAWAAPADAHEMTDAVTAAEPGAPGPISAVARAAQAPESVPPLPPVTRVPPRPEASDREPWAPALSPVPESEAFPETSGAVSAIAGAPDAGSPRSALASVSALHTQPHVPGDEMESLDATVVTRRKRTPWTLVAASGRSVPLTSDVLILGRRPAEDPAYPLAQLIAIDDDTRTVSKTHARLHLRDDRWIIVDLDSTNGVLLTDASGAEVEATAGVEAEAGTRFLLGDAEIRLERSDA